jgi:hypothetical protein
MLKTPRLDLILNSEILAIRYPLAELAGSRNVGPPTQNVLGKPSAEETTAARVRAFAFAILPSCGFIDGKDAEAIAHYPLNSLITFSIALPSPWAAGRRRGSFA